jgi:3-oxoacyl-[acyl-carrier-protein] synthase I
VLVSSRPGSGPQLYCTGLGFSQEQATILSDVPLRGDGLAAAIKEALADAGCAMHDLDFRITDTTGEHYYFKEAALALSRVLRQRKETFDIWHPTDCVGETGAAVGVVALAVARAACRKGYAIGPNILLHLGNDAGQRAAAILQYAETA